VKGKKGGISRPEMSALCKKNRKATFLVLGGKKMETKELGQRKRRGSWVSFVYRKTQERVSYGSAQASTRGKRKRKRKGKMVAGLFNPLGETNVVQGPVTSPSSLSEKNGVP